MQGGSGDKGGVGGEEGGGAEGPGHRGPQSEQSAHGGSRGLEYRVLSLGCEVRCTAHLSPGCSQQTESLARRHRNRRRSARGSWANPHIGTQAGESMVVLEAGWGWGGVGVMQVEAAAEKEEGKGVALPVVMEANLVVLAALVAKEAATTGPPSSTRKNRKAGPSTSSTTNPRHMTANPRHMTANSRHMTASPRHMIAASCARRCACGSRNVGMRRRSVVSGPTRRPRSSRQANIPA